MDTGITEKAIPEFQGSIGALGTGLNANSDLQSVGLHRSPEAF